MKKNKNRCNLCWVILGALLSAGLACKSPPTSPQTPALTAPGLEAKGREVIELEFIPASEDLNIPRDAPRDGTLRVVGTVFSGPRFFMNARPVNKSARGLLHNSVARRSLSEPDTYVAELATRVTVNEARTEYTIYLRKGVLWHRPQQASSKKHAWMKGEHEFTSEDLMLYFDLIRAPEAKLKGFAAAYEDLESVEALDRHTVKVIWKHGYFENQALTLEAFPLPAWLVKHYEDGIEMEPNVVASEFWGHWAGRYLVGTGPYVVKSRRQKSVLLANPDYMGPKPPFAKIEWINSLRPKEINEMMSAGEVDVALSRAPIEVKSKGTDVSMRALDALSYEAIGWNTKRSYFSDPRVRRAMGKALDLQRIVSEEGSGASGIQAGPYQAGHPANSVEASIGFDLKEASKLLDQAGWVDNNHDGVREKIINGETVDFRFQLSHFGDPRWSTLVEIYARDLKSIGVALESKPMGFMLLLVAAAKGEFDATWIGQELPWMVTASNWRSPMLFTGYNNAEVETLIEDLRTVFDPGVRVQKLQRIHALIHQGQPVTFTFQVRSFAAWNPNLRGVVFHRNRPQFFPLNWYFDTR